MGKMQKDVIGNITDLYGIAGIQDALGAVLRIGVHVNLICLIIRYGIAILNLEQTVVSCSPVYLTLSLLAPFASWVWLSGRQPFLNNHPAKYRFFAEAVMNGILTMIQPAFSVYAGLAGRIMLLPAGERFTLRTARFAACILLLAAWTATVALVAKQIFPVMQSEEAKETIQAYRPGLKADRKGDRAHEYSFHVLTDTKSGKPVVVPEADLYTHTTVVGASGTGKTSLVIIPQVIENLKIREENLDWQQQKVLELVREKKAFINIPFPRDEFNSGCIKGADKRREKELERIFDKRRTCGITVVAPNRDVGDAVIRYCSRRGIAVNNIDPTKKRATHPYERLCGMNALALPELFYDIEKDDMEAEEERTIRIAETANNLADALTAINELDGGSGDQYFTDVNTTVTSCVAQLVMLHASINRRQTDLAEVALYIERFDLLHNIVDVISKHFEIDDRVPENEKGGINKKIKSAADEREKGKSGKAGEEREAAGYTCLPGEEKKNPYVRTITTAKYRLIKGGQMDQHAEGLRNLMRKVLQDPQVERVLVKNSDTIDFDGMLSGGEITVINTALEIGRNSSTCFGQLFLLNFNSAVLRRPPRNRIPHFLYIDETARYLSDTLDTMCTLYRQYRVSVLFCLQSLKQVERVEKLSYLKDVLLSCGTIIAFGRTGTEDSEILSKMSGQARYDMPQKTESRASIFAQDPHTSTSVRYTPDIRNLTEPHDVRYRDFKECMILTSINGRPVTAINARAEFAPDELFEKDDEVRIKRKACWKVVWTARYPKKEGIKPLNHDTAAAGAKPAVFDMSSTILTGKHRMVAVHPARELPRSLPSRTHVFDDDDYPDEEYREEEKNILFSYMTKDGKRQEAPDKTEGTQGKEKEPEKEDGGFLGLIRDCHRAEGGTS